jgi:hypothetical protein
VYTVSGSGVNVKEMPGPDGTPVPLRESFAVDAHYAQCLVEEAPAEVDAETADAPASVDAVPTSTEWTALGLREARPLGAGAFRRAWTARDHADHAVLDGRVLEAVQRLGDVHRPAKAAIAAELGSAPGTVARSLARLRRVGKLPRLPRAAG